MTTTRVAVAQFAPGLATFEANVAAHLELAERAVALSASLLVFPELSLTGYFLKDLVAEVAIARDDERLAPLREASRRLDLVAGFVERGQGERYYLASGYFSCGELLHVHRKVYLPTYGMFEEARFLTPGDRVMAFDTPLGRVGLAICEDLWHPSTVGVLAADGADLLIGTAASPARGFGGDRPDSARLYEQMNQVYSQLYGMTVVFANRVGFEDGVGFWGGSEVVDPFGKLLAKAPYFDDALLIAELDPREGRRARMLTPLGRDERLEVTRRELDRISASRAQAPA